MKTHNLNFFVNVAETKKGSWKGKRNSKICTHCGKLGHTMDFVTKSMGFHLISRKAFLSIMCMVNKKTPITRKMMIVATNKVHSL